MDSKEAFEPLICVVNFDHQRGPEVEHWIGLSDGRDPVVEHDWTLLPFLALSDGSHQATEDFSYFTLVKRRDGKAVSSLFGIACTRQLDASSLIDKPANVTRSTVQKAVVVITDAPQTFAAVREKLSVVTKAWFAQRDFRDLTILEEFGSSLILRFGGREDGPEGFLGLSLREIVHTFRSQTLVLLKCLLLQPKMLFFGSQCERVCLVQFSLLSLIPALMQKLDDCADPELDGQARNTVKPTSLKSSDRNSLLTYMGLPLHIFAKGGFFGPYTPLQQLDMLMDQQTKSYVVGSTNALLMQQRDRYADVLVDVNDNSVSIFSPSLKAALSLTAADRRWMDALTQAVNDTWDESDPTRPKDLGFSGSEEMIRTQFEEYLLALLSSVALHDFMVCRPEQLKTWLAEVQSDPTSDFGDEFVLQWHKSENYAQFKRTTDDHIFDVIEARHPCAGGLTVEDVQRLVTQQVQDMHLDEKWRDGKEVLGKGLAEGSKRVTGAINSLRTDIESMREAQRKRAEEQKATQGSMPSSTTSDSSVSKFSRPDLSQAQATVSAASTAAGAYLSSWGSWAAEKRKTGWRSTGPSPTTPAGEASAAERPVSPGRGVIKDEAHVGITALTGETSTSTAGAVAADTAHDSGGSRDAA